ncbi:MAG: hypothetical protein ABGX40_03995 [Methylococcales bacterium]
MKWVCFLAMVLALAISTNSYAGTPASEADGYDVMMDVVFLRPLGFVGTVIGSAVFVGLSPLVAVASIPAPHDAFKRLADTLVVKPAKYTFVRQVGDYDYNEGLI